MKTKLLLAMLLLSLTRAFAAEPTRYVDAATLTVIGKALPTVRPYARIDTSVYAVPEKTEAYCGYSTGLAIVFRTDSKTIRARWNTSGRNAGVNMSAATQKGLDLYIMRDGRWVFAGVGHPRTGGKNDKHEAAIVSDMAEGEKLCLLYLPLFDRVDRLEIGIDDGSAIAAAENPFRRKIIFHGSSITHGAAAGRAGMSYPSLFGRRTGLHAVNLGFSGMSTLQPEFAAYLADIDDADAFVFDTFSNPDAKTIEERFDRFVDIIRAKHPRTPLIFMQTIRRETRNFSTRAEQFEARKQSAAERAVRERMKRDKNIFFIDSADWLGDDHAATSDGTHPTDLGFDRMLRHMQPRIVKILKRYGIE